MHIFPNSANKKKDLYPAYLKKAAQAEFGAEVKEEQEPVDDAFEAIKDLPMFGNEGAEGAPVAEVAIDVVPEGVPVAEVAPEAAPEGAAAAVEKAQAAVEEAAVAISEAVETISGGATEVAEVEVEVEEPKKDEECKDKKDEECKEEKKDEKSDADDSKPDFLKKEGDPDKDKSEEKSENPFAKKDEGETKEAAVSGGFMKIADLSPQVAKEVYEYWKALGMPEEFCKALTKKN
jgi:hypothetical protein